MLARLFLHPFLVAHATCKDYRQDRNTDTAFSSFKIFDHEITMLAIVTVLGCNSRLQTDDLLASSL